MPEPAVSLLHGPAFFTGPYPFDLARCVAVAQGRILAAGEFADLAKRFKTAARVALPEGYAYPAFADGHGHLTRLGASVRDADLRAATSWQHALDLLESHARRHTGGWLIGRGWDHEKWGLPNLPDRSELDLRFPDRPVFLERVDIHTALVNGKALQMAGLMNGPPPAVKGGEVLVQNGQPTGILLDHAIKLMSARFEAATPEDIRQQLLAAQEILLGFGVAAVGDALLTPEEARQIQALQQEGRFHLRVNAAGPAEILMQDPMLAWRVADDPAFRYEGLKIFADGVLGTRTAWLSEPYSDAPDRCGISLWSDDSFLAAAAFAARYQLQLWVHAIGDAALAQTLRVFTQAMPAGNPYRWRVEHIQAASVQDLAAIRQMGVLPSVQPQHALTDAPWVKDRLGPERVRMAYPLQSLLPEPFPLVLGSDFPVEPPNPLLGMHAALFRPIGLSGSEAISLGAAIAGYTRGPAYAAGAAASLGMISSGFFADFTLLDQPLTPENLASSEYFPTVEAVLISGKIVYCKS